MKLILCVLGALVCASSAFHIPGLGRKDVPAQCGDPTFACQDLASAKQCGVVSSCIHDIWSTMSVPDPVNDEVCDICKEMVKEARDQLLSNMTQEEIKEVFEGSCKLLPVKLIADACIKVVDEIIPQLVEMLASRMDPTMVCTVSGMCFATRTPIEDKVYKIVNIILTKDKTSQCDQCTALVQDAQNFLKSTSEEQVKTYLENFCDKEAPKYVCDLLLNHYMSDIYDYLKNTAPVDVCSSAGVCPKNCNGRTKLTDDLECEFCEHVLQHVKDLMTANTTMEEFKSALLNFCKHVGSWSDKCTSLVNDYYDMLFDYIKNLDTKGMCTLMGLCNNKDCIKSIPLVKLIPAEEPRPKFPRIKVRPADKVPENNYIPLVKLIPATALSKKEMKETNDIFQPLIPLQKFIHPILEQDTECALCKAFSFYLEKDLAGDKSKNGVRNAINGVCSKWMIEYPDHCERIVRKYSLRMQYAIAEQVSFDNLCSHVKSCPLEERPKEMTKLQIVHKAGPLCDLCKDAMNAVEKELSDPSIKQQLKAMADQGCKVLPSALRDDCVNFINQNIDAVIDMLQQELKPDNICPALGLCATPRISVPPRIKDLECDVCKDVVTSFRQKLQDPASKEIVLTFLEEGCARLPTSVSASCKKFVDEEIDTVMNIIISEMDPNTVCSLLKICPASLVVSAPKVANDIECELCKEVVAKVYDMIKDDKTEEAIQNALDKVCSYLPSSMATKCENFVNTYTKTLITLITSEMDPALVCAALNACPSSKQERQNKIKGVECELCKELIGKLEDMIKSKTAKDEIKTVLDDFCYILPSHLSQQCKNFVDNYSNLVIELLATGMDPEMICAAVSLCPKRDQLNGHQLKSFAKAKDFECESCQYAFHFLQTQLMDNATQVEVKNVLKRFCSLLPATFSNNCGAFVDEYGSSLLVLIAQEIDPNKLCFQLQMCPTQETFHHEKVQLNKFHLDECSVCTSVVDYLDKLLEEDDVDKEITQVIEKVCTVMPGSFRAQCTSILEAYGPYLLQMIGQLADSKQVCQDIDLCPRSPNSVHLIGGSKCTFGPSYWCVSQAHASACKAENFCKINVWKQ